MNNEKRESFSTHRGDEYDPEHHCEHGGDQVVGDRTAPHLPAEPEVERADGGDEGGDDQRDDDALQHPQEQLAHVLHVHHLREGERAERN